MELLLFGSDQCPLCDEAEALVHRTLEPGRYHLRKINILDSFELKKRYGLRIPVLAHANDETNALYWPFTEADLSAWWNTAVKQ